MKLTLSITLLFSSLIINLCYANNNKSKYKEISIIKSNKSNIALFDFDIVLKQLEIDKYINKNLINLEKEIDNNIKKTKSNLQNKINGLTKSYPNPPSIEARFKLFQTQNKLTNLINNIKLKKKERLNEAKNNLMIKFFNEVKPLILDFAKLNNFDVILKKSNNNDFIYSKKVDVTNEIISFIKKSDFKPHFIIEVNQSNNKKKNNK